jgi:hypothetical protein
MNGVKKLILQSTTEEELKNLRERLKSLGLEYNNHFEIWEFPHSGFSDYSGSMLERANAQSWKELLGDIVTEVHGGHGTTLIGIHDKDDEDTDLGSLTGEQMGIIEDTVRALQNYPVLNDELMSELEGEEYDRAWEDFYRKDYREDLQKQAAKENVGWDAWLPFSLSDEDMDELRYQLEQDGSIEHEIETGGSAYFRLPDYADIDLAAFDTPERRTRYERAKQAAWKAGLNDFIYKLLAESPDLEHAAAKLSQKRLFELVKQVLDADEDSGWLAPDTDLPGDPLTYDEDTLVRWVNRITPNSLQPRVPRRQMRLGL